MYIVGVFSYYLANVNTQMPITSLRLRPPIHHLCLTHLPGNGTSLVSGTKAGTVRRYDTRQRKPVGEYKIAREGGVGAVAPGRDEQYVPIFLSYTYISTY
jgi:hypothetical protein